MNDLSYEKARCLSRQIAAAVGAPRFYEERNAEIVLSGGMYRDDTSVTACARIVEEHGDRLGHGLDHAAKVAVEGGALVMIESGPDIPRAELMRLVRLAHLAGILHDIRREEENHARCGAEEAIVDGETGLLVPQGQPEAAAGAIVRLLRDPEAAARMGAAGRERARLMSWDVTAAKILAEYEAALRTS